MVLPVPRASDAQLGLFTATFVAGLQLSSSTGTSAWELWVLDLFQVVGASESVRRSVARGFG